MATVTVMQRTVEAPLIRHIVDKQNAHGAAVVGRRDGAEALLSCRVPLQSMAAHTELVPSWRGRGPCIDSTHNLELDLLAVEIYRADLEVDSDGAGDVQVVSGMRVSAWAAARVANPPVSRPRPPGLT